MRCALGFVVHTGWAVAVAVGDPPRLLARERVELVAGGFAEAGVYHAGLELSLADAERKVQLARAEAERNATQATASIVSALRAAGHAPSSCAIVGSLARLPREVAAILRSHALIHAAEGELYRAALAAGAQAAGLRVLAVSARELDPATEAVMALGREGGPPWGKDQKLAALAALEMLKADVSCRP